MPKLTAALGCFWFGLGLTASGCHSNAAEPRVATVASDDSQQAQQLTSTNGGVAAPSPSSTCGQPKDLGVRLLGRYDGCREGGPRAAWSGTGFVARFTGTGLAVTLDGPPLIFTTVIDGNMRGEFTTTRGRQAYTVAAQLPPGEHVVEVTRQGEASFGASVLEAVTVSEGNLLPPPERPIRRIEVLGDSITAGYGNEGTTPSCGFSAETENHALTYGVLLSNALSAELSTVAWSGKGIVSNYGGNLVEPMPTLYDRADPNDASSVWDFSAWQADAVIVNLSTNDYSTDHDPTDDAFVTTYTNLLATVRNRYPKAQIVCTVGPLLSGNDLKVAETNIQTAVNHRRAAGDQLVTFHAMRVPNQNPGCDWHPGLATHAAMARELTPVVRSLLGW